MNSTVVVFIAYLLAVPTIFLLLVRLQTITNVMAITAHLNVERRNTAYRMVAIIIVLLAIIKNTTIAMDLTTLLHLVASKVTTIAMDLTTLLHLVASNATTIVMTDHMVKTVIIQILPLSMKAIVADYGEEKNDAP